jgi:hypothetical protein
VSDLVSKTQVSAISCCDYQYHRLYEVQGRDEGDTKRCRLFLLTNSALVIRAQMWGEGGSCRVSANEYSCAHRVTWSPNKLWRSTSIFNLWSGHIGQGQGDIVHGTENAKGRIVLEQIFVEISVGDTSWHPSEQKYRVRI